MGRVRRLLTRAVLPRPTFARWGSVLAAATALAVCGSGVALADDPPVGAAPSPSATVTTYPAGSVVTVEAHLATLRRVLLRLDITGLDQSSAQAALDGQLHVLQDRVVRLYASRSRATGVSVLVRARDFEPGGIQAAPALDAPRADGQPYTSTIPLLLGVNRYRALVRRASAVVALPAINARAQLDPKKGVIFIAGRPAAALDTSRLGGELLAGLANGTARMRVVQTPAPYAGTQNQNIILIHTVANTLDYFVKGKKVRHLVVATGQAGYPTPHGLFHVIRKDPAPSWYNPHDDWSKDLPDVIGPGPNNPLGTRALQLDSPGILIHGIPLEENATLGRNASHGCIRVRRENIEALYPLVPVGTLVVIVS
jgi:lipoprotein-anchoring transpeptidase ErfK/SrfK